MSRLLFFFVGAGLCATYAVIQERKRRAVRQLLSEPDDGKLLVGVCERVHAIHGDTDAATWPEHERVATLAADTQAIIGNGGFSFLFSSNLNRDLTYRWSMSALMTIGAERAASVYLEALQLFPLGVPPLDLERRREAVANFDEATLNAIDSRFFEEMGEIERLAALYVRNNRMLFEDEWLAYRQ